MPEARGLKEAQRRRRLKLIDIKEDEVGTSIFRITRLKDKEEVKFKPWLLSCAFLCTPFCALFPMPEVGGLLRRGRLWG